MTKRYEAWVCHVIESGKDMHNNHRRCGHTFRLLSHQQLIVITGSGSLIDILYCTEASNKGGWQKRKGYGTRNKKQMRKNMGWFRPRPCSRYGKDPTVLSTCSFLDYVHIRCKMTSSTYSQSRYQDVQTTHNSKYSRRHLTNVSIRICNLHRMQRRKLFKVEFETPAKAVDFMRPLMENMSPSLPAGNWLDIRDRLQWRTFDGMAMLWGLDIAAYRQKQSLMIMLEPQLRFQDPKDRSCSSLQNPSWISLARFVRLSPQFQETCHGDSSQTPLSISCITHERTSSNQLGSPSQ